MKKKYKKSKRYYYYRKQRIYGLVLIGLAVFCAILFSGDITVSIPLAVLGLGLIFTKDRLIMDDYYWEMKAKEFDKWKEP